MLCGCARWEVLALSLLALCDVISGPRGALSAAVLMFFVMLGQAQAKFICCCGLRWRFSPVHVLCV